MRKTFLLITLLFLAFTLNAAEFYPDPADRNSIEAALEQASAGDVIYLDDASAYFNVKGTDGYTNLNKNITIRAIAGKNPVIKFEVPIMISNSASAKIIGVKFDGSSLVSSDYSALIRFNDNSNNYLELEDCEFTGVGKYMIYVPTGNKAASCVIKNCNIHDNTQRIFYNYKANVEKLEIINTEIANNSHYIIHNCEAQMGSLTFKNCDIHANSKRCLLNEGTLNSVNISGGKFYNLTSEAVFDNYTNGVLSKLLIDGSECYGNTQPCINCAANSQLDSCIIIDPDFHGNSKRFLLNEGTITSIDIRGGKLYNNTNEHVIVNNTNAIIGNLKMNGTEFYGNAKACILGTATSMMDSCIVENCYFHNNSYAAISFQASTVANQQTSSGVKISKSTFANNDASSDYLSIVDVRSYASDGSHPEATDDIEVVVDHCTFYNNSTMNSDYAEVGTRIVNRTTITNCIFAHETAEVDVTDGPKNARRATCCNAGIINNCLTYNLMKDAGEQNSHRQSNKQPVLFNNITADPLFTDAPNGDLSFTTNNWVTMNLSPACGAATDGLDLGDTRWHTTAATIPSSDFSTSYDLVGEKAALLGKIRLNSNNHIEYYDKEVAGIATWRIRVLRECALHATIDMETGSSSGSILQLAVFDAEGNKVDVTTASYKSDDEDIEMPGTLYFPAAGDYTIRLTNNQTYSSAKIEKIILVYSGGSILSLPNTLTFTDAILSDRAHITDNKLYFAPIGSYNPAGEWARWSVTTDHAGTFLFTMNVASDNGQSYKISLLDSDKKEITSYEKKVSSGTAAEIKRYLYLEAGDYYVEVQNTTAWSHGYIVSLVVTEPDDVITLDEGDNASNTPISDALLNQTKNVQIIRTLKGGVYNTFCLPFGVSYQAVPEIFGADVKIFTLAQAIVEDNILTLTFATASDIWQGTPVFIQPVKDVVNPFFENVEFKVTTPQATTKTNANFTGTFIQTTLQADPNILFLESGTNKVFYPTAETPIKGMRGWLVIHDTPTPSYAIKHAHIIVQGTGETTDVEIIGDEFHVLNTNNSEASKIFENGQVIIIRDSIRYNMVGQRLE